MEDGRAGFALDRGAATGFGLLGLTQRQVDFGQMVMKGGRLRIELDGAGDVLQRLGMTAAGVLDETQQVPGVGVALVELEDLAIDAFGLAQVAGLVRLDRRVQGF